MPKLDSRSALTIPSSGDLLLIQDVSDTTDGATGTSKKITWANLSGEIFRPSDYGAVGDGSTDDTAAVQAAIDAAEVAGGIVFLEGKTYRIADGGTMTLGSQTQVDYGLHVNANNVYIHGPGTFVLTAKPTLTNGSYALLVLGRGGIHATPDEWIDYVGVVDVVIDATALSAADRNDMDVRLGSGSLVISSCRYFLIDGVTIFNGWGYDGAINGNLSSRRGLIRGCTVTSATNFGIWCDGAYYTRIIGNFMDQCVNGINLQANGDQLEEADFNIVTNNIIYLFTGTGISQTGGSNNLLCFNELYTEGTSVSGITMTADSNATENYYANHNLIVGNKFKRVGGVGTNYAVKIEGVAVSDFDGQPIWSEYNYISANYIDSGWSLGPLLGQYARNNVVQGNSINTAGLPFTFHANSTSNICKDNHINTTSSTWGKLTANSATPSVQGDDLWQTQNTNPTTITNFANGFKGQCITVLVKDANTTIDFTGTNLKGNGGADWSPASGDFMVCHYDGTNWYCEVHDTTA